jgi:hypothetical protein
MAKNQTNTYEAAKNTFETLGFREDAILPLFQPNVRIFRKHLSEMIRRQKSGKKFASRIVSEGLKVIRIE